MYCHCSFIFRLFFVEQKQRAQLQSCGADMVNIPRFVRLLDKGQDFGDQQCWNILTVLKMFLK